MNLDIILIVKVPVQLLIISLIIVCFMKVKIYVHNVKKDIILHMINNSVFLLIMKNMMKIVPIINNSSFLYVQNVNQDTILEIICV